LVDLRFPGVRTGDDVVEEVDLRLVLLLVLDCRAEPMIVEFLEQTAKGRAFHFLLVQRLDCGEPRGGTGFRSCGGSHLAGL
jgi:hypothetical protein